MLARRRLPHFLFEYIDGGSYAEATLARNVDDLAAITLRQRVLRDVSAIDLSTEWFGRRLSMPVAFGPIGLAGMIARRGEVQAARAAESTGIPFRSEEHKSELQSLMRISYADFCLKKKKTNNTKHS